MARAQDTIPDAATLPVDALLKAVLPNLDRSYLGTKWYSDNEGHTRKPVLKAVNTNTFDVTRVGGSSRMGGSAPFGTCPPSPRDA